jgi:hypothetical protein
VHCRLGTAEIGTYWRTGVRKLRAAPSASALLPNSLSRAVAQRRKFYGDRGKIISRVGEITFPSTDVLSVVQIWVCAGMHKGRPSEGWVATRRPKP